MNIIRNVFIHVIVEDQLQELCIRKLLEIYRSNVWADYQNSGGKDKILKKIHNLYKAATDYPHIVCIDLDRDECAPSMLQDLKLLHVHSPQFMLRIMVREVEAWILADRANFARYLGISVKNIPTNTETINDPKEFIISLARRSKQNMRDLIPIGCGKVGPGYNAILGKFISVMWDPEKARFHNDSLNRAIDRLAVFPRL
jgi:hypothetical protein